MAAVSGGNMRKSKSRFIFPGTTDSIIITVEMNNKLHSYVVLLRYDFPGPHLESHRRDLILQFAIVILQFTVPGGKSKADMK